MKAVSSFYLHLFKLCVVLRKLLKYGCCKSSGCTFDSQIGLVFVVDSHNFAHDFVAAVGSAGVHVDRSLYWASFASPVY